jgi:hypothetical protein
MSNKDTFIEIYKNNIKRDGADALLEWLLKSDFFTAPASTKYHGAYEGGLVEHSINVYEQFVCNDAETRAICALLHDVCKVNFYKTDFRNVKDEKGVWQKVPYYAVDDQLPYGHGEKSVYIISGFMKLTREESMAIRWHMGGFDDAVRGGSYSMGAAFEKYPLAVYLHTADMLATYTLDGPQP